MTGSSEAYGAFAYAYDRALGARFFGAVRRLLDDALEQYPTAKRTHLDLACGTGLALEYFRELGWSSVGVDASTAMLQLAKTRESRVIAADLRAIPLRRRFARVTCLYDSLNHLLERDDLTAGFQGVRAALDHDGLFLFDVNHPDIYPEVWGASEPFVAAGRDFRLEIATSYRRRDRMAHAQVTGWAMIGGERVEIEEEHRQRAYSEREIERALSEAGLAQVDVIDFNPYDDEPAEAPSVKLFYICRARS